MVGTTALTIWRQLPDVHPLKGVISDFVRDYEAQVGQGKADMFAAQAYDAVMIPVSVWSKVPESVRNGDLAQARVTLRDGIENTRDYHGAVGIFNFSTDDHLGLDSRSTILVVVKDGRFTALDQ